MTDVLRARVVRRLYVIFGGVWAGLFVLAVAASLRAPSFVQAALIALAGLIGFVLALSRYEVRVNDGTLTYVTLFTGRRSVRLDQIKSVSFEHGYSASEHAFQPPTRLLVIPDEKTGLAPIRINVGVFRDQDMTTLYTILRMKDL